MSTVTQPTLAGQALPYPREYTETVIWRAGYAEMADGTPKVDLVATAPKRAFRLAWAMVPETGIDNIVTAYGLTGGDPVTFVTPMNDSYSVVRASDASELRIDWTVVRGAFYGACDLTLVEV